MHSHRLLLKKWIWGVSWSGLCSRRWRVVGGGSFSLRLRRSRGGGLCYGSRMSWSFSERIWYPRWRRKRFWSLRSRRCCLVCACFRASLPGSGFRKRRGALDGDPVEEAMLAVEAWELKALISPLAGTLKLIYSRIAWMHQHHQRTATLTAACGSGIHPPSTPFYSPACSKTFPVSAVAERSSYHSTYGRCKLASSCPRWTNCAASIRRGRG